MINWTETNSSNRYYYLKKSHVSHHILWITARGQNSKQWTLTPLTNSTFNNAWPRAAHSLLMHHFSLLTYDIKMNIIIVTYNFQWFCGLNDFLSRCMHYRVWIHCCKWPNYDFCISQASVVIVLRWSGLKLQSLTLSFFVMLHAKNYQNWPMFQESVIQ